jgi:hypothetical protein
MEATPTQIINYFSGFKQNLVPLFQRPYTWAEKQWRTLWDDVISFYGSDLADRKSTHFMGAVVTMPARSVPVGVSKFLIIDGQQRLTTVALLMCAIRDSVSDADQVHRRRIQNFYLTNEGYEGTEFFKLLPTQGDREQYGLLVKNTGSAFPDSQFKKAYDFFRRRLRDEVDDGTPIDPKRVLEIIESRLMVVMINLGDTDDPYLIFESLNFKGSPLEQADLVRNYFLMRFRLEEQQTVYEGLWLPMQNRLGANLTEFMRHFLGSEGEEVRKSDVYTAIKKLVADSDAASVRVLMTRMERLSTLYSRLSAFAHEPHPDLEHYFDHFKRLDFGSVYPLLLSLYDDYDEGQFSIDEFASTLRILHSFILRRMVAAVPSNSLAGLFISLCRTKPVTDAPSAWLSTSLGREDKNRRWPSDTEFGERWVHGRLYGSRACQIILECLEEEYGHHEAVPFVDVSVEHVMPQTLTPAWEASLGPEAIRLHGEWLHTVGNLTLTGYNPELSNKPYSEKRTTYALSHFELNRSFGHCESWGPAEIGDRASALFRTALHLWPRPPLTVPSTTPLADKTAPAGFHTECIGLVQQELGIHLSKLSQTRYESGDRQVRLTCAVSAEHNETGGIPYYWFAVHKSQLDFLQEASTPWICFGCSSAETTLLVPFSEVRDRLELMSVTKNEDRHYWHVVVQRKSGQLILRLLGGTDGPDLTKFNTGKTIQSAPVN